MKILALDSSGLVASVAVMEDDTMLAEYTMNYKRTHSQTLLPMLDEMAKMIELDLNSVDAIAVAGGPGSFTGLRIGSATAKGLGLALKKPIISIPTVDGLAYNLCGTDKIVCPLMDARRNQVYTGIYEFQRRSRKAECVYEEAASADSECLPYDYDLKVLEPQMAVDISEIAEKLNALGREVIFLGDGWPVYAQKLTELMKVPYMAAPAHMSRQRAGALAALAMCYAKEGLMETATEHQPDYLRLSQAERERAEKEKAAK